MSKLEYCSRDYYAMQIQVTHYHRQTLHCKPFLRFFAHRSTETLRNTRRNAERTERPHADASLSNSNPNNNNKSKDDDNADAIIINGEDALSFDTIWEMYGKPIGKKEQIKPLWDALSDEDKAAIYAYIPLYVRSTPEIRYRKNLNNFLLERYWENHPLTPNDNERNGSSTPSDNENSRRRQEVCNAAIEAINSFNHAAGNPSLPFKHAPNATEIPNMG